MELGSAEWLISAACGLVFVMVAYLALPQCPNCKSRSLRWDKATKRGRKDLRYTTNNQSCSSCGWSSATGTPADREAAAEAQRQQLDQAKKQAEAASETQRQTLVLLAERAHAAQMEASEAAEAKRREEEDLTRTEECPKAAIWLLLFIAKADRRYTDSERAVLQEQIVRLFPSTRQTAIIDWADKVKTSPDALHTMLPVAARLPPETKRSLLDAMDTMARADGKATRAELASIASIRAGLYIQ